MSQQIVETASGILIFVRDDAGKLVSVRFVDAAIAHYYTAETCEQG